MKIAMRVVSLQKREIEIGTEWIIHSIYESVEYEVPEGQTFDQVVTLKSGRLNVNVDAMVQMGLADIAKGFAHKLEIHLKTYE